MYTQEYVKGTTEDRWESWIPQRWNYSQVWVLGAALQSHARAANALKDQTTLLALPSSTKDSDLHLALCDWAFACLELTSVLQASSISTALALQVGTSVPNFKMQTEDLRTSR